MNVSQDNKPTQGTPLLSPSSTKEHVDDWSLLLWPAGFTLILALCLWNIFIKPVAVSHIRESSEWLIYAAFGLTFTMMTASILLFKGTFPPRIVQIILSFGILLGAASVIHFHHALDGGIGIVLALVSAYCLTRGTNVPIFSSMRLGMLLACIISVAWWSFAIRLVHWTSFSNQILHNLLSTIIFASIYLLIIFCLKMNTRIASPGQVVFQFCLFDIFAYAIFLALGCRTDSLFNSTTYFHWSYYLGPIESVKHGAWLLWDVPSQYGFLSIAATAAIPIRDAIVCLFLIQSLMLFIVAILLYQLICKWGSAWYVRGTALILTISTIYFSTSETISPSTYPSGSVMRFFWCFPIVVLFYQWRYQELLCQSRKMCTLSMLWVIGALWSPESCIYVCIICLSGLFTHALTAIQGHTWNAKHWKGMAIPLVTGLIAIAAIDLLYLSRLHHLPDWSSFFEYATAYSTKDIGALPIDPKGAIWALLSIFSLCTCVTFYRNSEKYTTMKACLPLLAMLGSVTSYFIGRSHEWNITVLIPMMMFALCIIYELSLRHLPDSSLILVKVMAAPFLIIVGTCNIFTKSNLSQLAIAEQSSPLRIGQKIPRMDATAQVLLEKMHVSVDQPLVYYNDLANNYPPGLQIDGKIEVYRKSWLPCPLTMIQALDVDRRNEYYTRFFEKESLSGWLMMNKLHINDGVVPMRFIENNFKIDQSIENDNWILSHYVVLPLSEK